VNPPPPFWRRALRALWQWPLALLILFEEWGWEPLHRLLLRIGRWPGFRWLEARIQTLPPKAALLVLVLPSLLILPIKLLALWAISQGHALLGLAVILGAKVLGTAVLARLFNLTQPALMQLGWFARYYLRFSVWKAALLARVRASWPWRWGRVLKHRAKRSWKALMWG